MARKIVVTAGAEEILRLLKDRRDSAGLNPVQGLKYALALGACNLGQTLRMESLSRKLSPDFQKELLRDYVTESAKFQSLVKLGKREETEEMSAGVMGLTEEILALCHEEEDPAGPGPRYQSVKEILHRLGAGDDYALHDGLFELMNRQHEILTGYFLKALDGTETPK